MSDLSIVFAFLALAAVAYWMYRRVRGRPVSAGGYLLRYTALDGWVVIPAVVSASGLLADGVTYPVPARVQIAGVNVWILLADAPAMVEHEALERARESAALSSLWQGGGQWLDFLRLMGVLLPVVFSIVVWQQVSNLAAIVVQIAASVEALK